MLKNLFLRSNASRSTPGRPAAPVAHAPQLHQRSPRHDEDHQNYLPGYADQSADPGVPPWPGHTDAQGYPLPVRHGSTYEDEIFDDAIDAPGYMSIHGVKKAYKKRTVVRGVSLSVGRGESIGLLGPNGAGKTTVFYMITGLVPADDGTITLDGVDVTRMPMYQRARLGIGYLPQEASIFRGLTVEQNIMSVLEIAEPDKKMRKEKLESLLEEFQITRLRKSPSIALSGGERRRCEIARALASNPSYMLLDEPFAGIDPIAVGDIQHLVRHLTDRGIGVLITDHNVRETLALIDRAYIIYDGQVLTHGNPQEIIANEDVRRVYLGDMFVNGR